MYIGKPAKIGSNPSKSSSTTNVRQGASGFFPNKSLDHWADNLSNDFERSANLSDSGIERSDVSNNSTARRSTKVSPMPIEEMEKQEKSLSKSRTSRKSSDDDKPIEKIKLTEGVVQDYINLEKSINKLERKNVLKKFESQTIYADNLKNTGQWDDRLSKEKTEYVDALNRQETVQKELNMARVNYENSLKIMDIYKQQTDNLNALYEKQDKMLAGIFGTDYASEKENILEGEVDDMVDWQQRVSLAMFKWANGRVLLVHALTQITFGINRWMDVKAIDRENQRARYFAAAEARNNFVAAAQNVQSCRMYLNKVEFPYATEAEINHLEDTVARAFKNVQDDGEVKKALKVFQDTQKKVASLIQWFDKVINETIRKDLDLANNAVIKKQKALREERLSLMKKKAKKELGHDMHIEYDNIDDDELERELKALEEQALKDVEALTANNVSDIIQLGQQDADSAMLPLGKLAPIPSKEALFGDVKQKLSEHDSNRRQFEKRNHLQREKQAIALQEKLKLRQQKGRRTRNQRRQSIAPVDVERIKAEIAPVEKKVKKRKSSHHRSKSKTAPVH
ncbi:hypothetical protein WR25_02298 [Diploscapter pachys]|uniref:Uncharacterized protein n=1 Tax=Diploscapter pachys TaxID=2018661 RepID=A0A2A2J6U4_9BILA|nr:hypothetical protein WR25_02298 [Diploscapter pachys]